MTSEESRTFRKEIKAGIEEAKQGKGVKDLYDKLSALHKEGNLNPELHRDFGWLIYYRTRHTGLNFVMDRKRMLLQYLKLELERPSLLHSLMLSEAIKLKKSNPSQFRLRDFLNLWGLENLREEDWEKFKPSNGHSSNSLVENLIGNYVKEVKKDGCKASDEFALLLEKALQNYRSNPHLPLYKALVLVSQDKKEEALAHYKSLLRRWPKKFFLWSNSEELLPYKEIDTRIALLSKAITLVRDKGFLGNIRLRLANLLYKKGLYANALHEVEQYQRYYFSQGWHIKRWCETLTDRITAASPGLKSSPTPYSDFIPLADQFANMDS